MKNFDFVRIAIESNKDRKINAAKLAQQNDYKIETEYQEDMKIVKREDKLQADIQL